MSVIVLMLRVFLFALIDPFIWLKSMSTLGFRKDRKYCYTLYVCGYTITVAKEILASYMNNNTINVLFNVLITVYLVAGTIWICKGKNVRKFVYICVFYVLLFLTELVAIGIFTICARVTIETIMTDPVINFLCGCTSKVILAISCYFLYVRNVIYKLNL